MSYDVRIRTFLEEPVNGSLKYPKSRDDYIGLVKLVADDSRDDFWGESTDVLMGRIRRKHCLDSFIDPRSLGQIHKVMTIRIT